MSEERFKSEVKYFLAMKIFLNDYYDIYGPANDTLQSLLSNLGRCSLENFMPPDPALWQMWNESLDKASGMYN